MMEFIFPYYFVYPRWKDFTDTDQLSKSMEFKSLKDVPFVKVTLVKLLLFADQASFHSYRTQEMRFYNEEGRKDLYTSIHSLLEGKVAMALVISAKSVRADMQANTFRRSKRLQTQAFSSAKCRWKWRITYGKVSSTIVLALHVVWIDGSIPNLVFSAVRPS